MIRHALALVPCLLASALTLGACSTFTPDDPPAVIHARFDPDAKVIPMPTDVLRDDAAGHLDIPIDDTLSAAERELYGYLNTLDGWSSASSATVELTGAIAPTTVGDDSLQIWKWGGVPQRVTDARLAIADDEKTITLDAPRLGWERGAQYVVLLRGGDAGVEGKLGERLECDAAFYFLRQTERLDTPEHNRAFPGDTTAERAENAAKLEAIREELAPHFDYFAARGIPRDQVAALWRFTITDRVELAMDKSSQRMPLPIQLMIDPATGHVDLPSAPWDTAVETEAKRRLRAYTGFATSANLLFQLTGPIQAASLTADSVQLWRLGGTPTRVAASARLLPDLMAVAVTPAQAPLDPGTTYTVVVTDQVKDATGRPIIAMPAGALLKAQSAVAEAGASRVKVVPDDDAVRIEGARASIEPLLDQIGRDHVVAAWPFTTMVVQPRIAEIEGSAAATGVSPQPASVTQQTALQALTSFPLAITSLLNVEKVMSGTIESPYFLDDTTRAWREDGGHRVDKVPFMMTVPRNLPAGPAPVVIFGHAIMTERRFVLAIGDALAAKGFVVVAIDLPYHGTRTQCIAGGPISVVNPTTGDLTSLPPCQSGTTCNPQGRCVDAAGQGNALTQWPLLNYPIASGAAFLEIEHIANTKDHFDQAVIDLAALERSLRQGDWSSVIGRSIDKTRIYYAGQSLGGILGATYLAGAPDISRAVLNVPGADLVDMFDDSTWFGPQVDGFFTRQHITRDSFEGERFLDVARWMVDAVDPQNLGPATGHRNLMIQMATLDFIIPNAYTKVLERVTGAPYRDYVAEHAFLVIPVEPEFGRGGRDMASFLAGELTP